MHELFKSPLPDFSLWGGPDDQDVVRPAEDDIPRPPWWTFFQYDLYDWSDPWFVAQNVGPRAYRPILLTRGYFMMVPVVSYEAMLYYPDGRPKCWYTKLNYVPGTRLINKAYAARPGRKQLGEPRHVLAHRELMDSLRCGTIIDHMNGWGLDNRGNLASSINLRVTSHAENMSNSVRTRKKNPDLPPGVEPWGRKFGGIRAYRMHGEPIYVRSPEKYDTPEPAHEWYREQLAKIYKNRSSWAHSPESVDYPIFPPLKDPEPLAEEEIPF